MKIRKFTTIPTRTNTAKIATFTDKLPPNSSNSTQKISKVKQKKKKNSKINKQPKEKGKKSNEPAESCACWAAAISKINNWQANRRGEWESCGEISRRGFKSLNWNWGTKRGKLGQIYWEKNRANCEQLYPRYICSIKFAIRPFTFHVLPKHSPQTPLSLSSTAIGTNTIAIWERGHRVYH